MNRRQNGYWPSVAAAAAAVALTAGLTTPVSAAPSTTAGAVAPARAAAGPASTERITLITGDRVVIGAGGRVLGFEAARGRSHVTAHSRHVGGRTLVVPADAQRLLDRGVLDPRLFDTGELTRAAAHGAPAGRGSRLKVIVSYRGAAAEARSAARSAGGTTLRRSLRTLNSDALTTSEGGAAKLWEALTDERAGGRYAARGVSRVWLDGVRAPALERSVPQIGAPKAWSAGLTGKGVTIAVLDTGVHAAHPDLRDRLVGEKNFTDSPDTEDRYGHGTHVASIAVGTGAAAPPGRSFKGVAPGAGLLSGKVMRDHDGYGEDSAVLAGMDWAVQQGADVINLSFASLDTPETDLLEAHINRLTAERDVLFVAAAGNGGESALGSPGSAESALTVGNVDHEDRLDPLSSTGPRVGDGGIKPDVTAPGVAVTAAAAPGSSLERDLGQDPVGYLASTGTSMSAPHVAGVAALLKQRHPDWTAPQLKAALVASTESGPYSPVQQGSGRVRADRAIEQTVIAEPVSLAFGTASWPHTDDTPVTRELTYRNLGDRDVTLDLALSTRDPAGRPAPDGFFALGAQRITVPRGGTAAVPLTADTRIGGDNNGTYGAYVVATGGGQRVRTAATVDREVESYEVTVKAIGRDGAPATDHWGSINRIGGPVHTARTGISSPTGTTTVRLPKGRYSLEHTFSTPDGPFRGTDRVFQPQFDLSRRTTLTVDARTAEPIDITVPDRAARQTSVFLTLSLGGDDRRPHFLGGDSWEDVRIAHAGPPATAHPVRSQWNTHWVKGTTTQYATAQVVTGKKAPTGHIRRHRASDFATVKLAVGSPGRGEQALIGVRYESPNALQPSVSEAAQPLPGTRTLRLSTGQRATWGFDVTQFSARDADGLPIVEAVQTLGATQSFAAGRVHTRRFNTGIFGPRLGGAHGLTRNGNQLSAAVPLFSDGQGHAGTSTLTSARTTLHRGSTEIAESRDSLQAARLTLPAAEGRYTLASSAVRSDRIAGVSTRIDTRFTFRTRRTTGATPIAASTVRFGAVLAPDSTAPAGRVQSVPVTVQGSAAGSNLASLDVYASYDRGRTWRRLTIRDGAVSVQNPAAGRGVALRAKVTDRQGNTSTVSLHDAYLGR
ncbi:S8 family serine peptidase [Streptomyces sp. NPDC127068]|uniref:S8 family peptidase n=1 Tax=Streptomyces sp. NPDC127068 TaxID=3347127 RepID=UPI00365E1C3D